jgi:hypothetical protein
LSIFLCRLLKRLLSSSILLEHVSSQQNKNEKPN